MYTLYTPEIASRKRDNTACIYLELNSAHDKVT